MLRIPRYAIEMLNIIKDAGYEAYAVGGCVRDALLGKEPTDIDITTSAPPETIQALFPHSALTGGRFFTVTAFHGGGKAEITPFRSEGSYLDSRRPESVSFASKLSDDLKRRDFTMNAVCFDGKTVIDPLCGRADIDAGVIRCVGDPERRFDEDALRIMRAFRFSAELGFDIEPETVSAALNSSHKLKNISVERIRDELVKAVVSPMPERISPLLEHGALSFLDLNASPLLTKLKLLNNDTLTRLSAFLIICGTDAAEKLKLPARSNRFISSVFAAINDLPPQTVTGVKHALKRVSADAFMTAAEIAEKLYEKSDQYSILCRRIIDTGAPYRISDLALNGNDLKNAGVAEKEIGSVLEHLLDTVIEDPELNTRESLTEITIKQCRKPPYHFI